jgi:hypothetical protein
MMAKKLCKYYDRTKKPFVYPNSIILEPCGKLQLFRQQTWDDNYANDYDTACRQRYKDEYESVDLPEPSSEPLIKKRKLADVENETDDYRTALNKVARTQVTQNEYDRYLAAPIHIKKDEKDTLRSWKQMEVPFPHLSRMARDTFAVPATGAGVERQFSKSGKVATSGRIHLLPNTIRDQMMYKDHLTRIGRPLIHKKYHYSVEFGLRTDENDEENRNGDGIAEDEDDQIKIVDRETEWWQKIGAKINH